MDFNTIYQTIAPYLGTGAIATGIITILAFAIKALGVIKQLKKSFSATESEAIKAFKKAIPESLYVSVEGLAKTELAKIKDEITQAVRREFIEPVKANTQLTEAIAAALVTMRNVPDSAKNKINAILELGEPKTTESLKVELLPVDTEKSENADNIYID